MPYKDRAVQNAWRREYAKRRRAEDREWARQRDQAETKRQGRKYATDPVYRKKRIRAAVRAKQKRRGTLRPDPKAVAAKLLALAASRARPSMYSGKLKPNHF